MAGNMYAQSLRWKSVLRMVDSLRLTRPRNSTRLPYLTVTSLFKFTNSSLR